LNIETLMDVFCKSREIQAYFTKLLNDRNLSGEERKLIIVLIQNLNTNSNLLKEYYLKSLKR